MILLCIKFVNKAQKSALYSFGGLNPLKLFSLVIWKKKTEMLFKYKLQNVVYRTGWRKQYKVICERCYLRLVKVLTSKGLAFLEIYGGTWFMFTTRERGVRKSRGVSKKIMLICYIVQRSYTWIKLNGKLMLGARNQTLLYKICPIFWFAKQSYGALNKDNKINFLF